jgi:hypothetical protein
MLGAGNGVFCLEGQWASDLRDRASVLPTLVAQLELALARFNPGKTLMAWVPDLTVPTRGLQLWGARRPTRESCGNSYTSPVRMAA